MTSLREGEGKVMEAEDMITLREYVEALARMKNEKTSGEDGIREGGERLNTITVELINTCWPDGLGRTIILPVYNGNDDAGDFDNYRGIALLDHQAKA